MCLWDQVIADIDRVVGRVGHARGLSNDNIRVVKGKGIENASEGSETTAETAGARRQSQGIYDDDGDVRGGR